MPIWILMKCCVAVIYSLCKEWDVDFYAMYALTGIWNTVFLLIYAFFDLSRLMKWSTR